MLAHWHRHYMIRSLLCATTQQFLTKQTEMHTMQYEHELFAQTLTKT